MAIRIDAEKCNGCEECIAACPTEALRMQDGIPVVDDELCGGCAAGEGACPTGALQTVEASETR